MSVDYCELVLTCDTRERNKDRVKAISSFFEENGAIVQNEKLERCDYHIEGELKGVHINLGIENKVLVEDFFPSMESMPTKFFESYKYYNDVALFVEEGNYSLKCTDDGLDAWIQNPAMQNSTGLEGVGTLSMYNNFIGSMAHAGLHVRTYRSIAHFPITVSGLLKSIIKPVHRGISIENPEKTFYKDMMNVLVKLPGVGAKTAEKGLRYIPNLNHLNSMSEEDFQDMFGEVHGKKLWGFINNTSRKDECSDNWQKFYDEKLSKKRIPSTKKEPKTLKLLEEKKEKSDGAISKELSTVIQSPSIDIPVKEEDLWPHSKDVVEYIRKNPKTLSEIGSYFGFSPEYCMKSLYYLQEKGRIHFNKTNLKWEFGRDMTPLSVTSDKEIDVGV